MQFNVRPGFQYSVANIYKDVWQQEGPYCLAYSGAHLMTILYRQIENDRRIEISPQEIVNARAFKIHELEECLINGVYDIKHQQFLGMCDPMPQDPSQRLYKIDGFNMFEDKDGIVEAILENFTREGIKYPAICICNMVGLDDETAKKATPNQPFVQTPDSIKDKNPRHHAMVITGVCVISVYPKLEIAVEVKNSDGPYWGTGGYSWVAPGFFHSIAVPVKFDDKASSRSGGSSTSLFSSKDLGAYAQSLPSASDCITSTPSLTTKDAVDKYRFISEELESLIEDNKETEIQAVIGEVPGMILRCFSRDEAALAVAQKVFEGLYENASNTSHVGAHLAMLAVICDVSKLVFSQLTSWVIYSEKDRKFNKDITVGLISRELLNLAEYNNHLAKLLDAGKNKVATVFAISLIQTLVASDARVISELHNVVDVLAKLATSPDASEALQQLVEVARNPAASLPAGKDDFNRQQKDKKVANYPVASRDDTIVLESSFQEQVSLLFDEWYKIYELSGVDDQLPARFVLQLQQNSLLKADDTSDCFFCCLMDIAVSHCISSEGAVQSNQQTQALYFLAIDMYASLVFSILKFSAEHGLSKMSILSKVLPVTMRFIQKDAQEKKTSFNPRPYFRLFIDWLLDLSTLDLVFEGANFQVLTALATSFHALQPLKVLAFSFVWLELVSHGSFLPKLLSGIGQKRWPYFQRLLVDLFQFMEPFLRNAELGEPVCFLYKGTLRVLLVLLHDFPEFLCDYHFSFCEHIPPSCIQMQNIVLSAFPHNMRLPDPSTPNLKIDLLSEISQSPCILAVIYAALKAKQMKNDIDKYIKTRPQGTSFLSELKQKLLLSPSEAARAGTRYNVPLMNSLVLYVGMQEAIQEQITRVDSSNVTWKNSNIENGSTNGSGSDVTGGIDPLEPHDEG